MSETAVEGPYTWSASWEDPPDASSTMAHSSIAITRDGRLVTGATSDPGLWIHQADGGRRTMVPVADVVNPHGLTLVEHGGEELVWIADTGTLVRGGAEELTVDRDPAGGKVLLVDLEGNVRQRLARPPSDVYRDCYYAPTGVAVATAAAGGSGDVWVVDGYGAGLLHRYDSAGRHLESLDGTEGAGRFSEPHDVTLLALGGESELWVTDRRNARIQVFDLAGRFKRAFGTESLRGPTQLAAAGDRVVVTDLLAGRLTVFDAGGRCLGHLFAAASSPSDWDDNGDGWPNARGADGTMVAATLVDGAFRCPHGIAFGDDGTMYVSEFAIGGRIAVLTPRPE